MTIVLNDDNFWDIADLQISTHSGNGTAWSHGCQKLNKCRWSIHWDVNKHNARELESQEAGSSFVRHMKHDESQIPGPRQVFVRRLYHKAEIPSIFLRYVVSTWVWKFVSLSRLPATAPSSRKFWTQQIPWRIQLPQNIECKKCPSRFEAIDAERIGQKVIEDRNNLSLWAIALQLQHSTWSKNDV